MRSVMAVGLFFVAMAGACGGESTKTVEDDSASGEAGEPSSGGSAGATAGTGGSVSTGGAPSGGAPNGGSQTGGVPAGGTGTGGAPPTGGSAGGPSGCTPQRVSGVGACDAAFGPFFLGTACGWVGGCSCEGEDCDAEYESEQACEQAHRGCLVGCTPQQVGFVGSCEPLPRKVFTGVECVEMNGCSCIGSDCGNTYPTASDPTEPAPATCESAHRRCSESSRSCEEIESVYAEYASRDACEEDADCRLTIGHCTIGLGGCYYFMNRQWPVDGLDSLAAEFRAGNCSGGICSCTAPPASVRCVDGHCMAGP